MYPMGHCVKDVRYRSKVTSHSLKVCATVSWLARSRVVCIMKRQGTRFVNMRVIHDSLVDQY